MTQFTAPNKGCAVVELAPIAAARCNRGVSDESTTSFGLPARVRARLMGAALMGMGLALVLATVLVLVLKLPLDILSGIVILVVIGVFVLGFVLVRRWYVVRLGSTGYQIRFVRGAGVEAARWTDVEDMTTQSIAGSRCVVLRLRDGRTTTIPVDLVQADPEQFVEELRRRLDAGHGYKRRS